MTERGLRIFGRTAIECSVDSYAVSLADELAARYSKRFGAAATPGFVADLFCGSGNIAYHIGRHLAVPTHAVELDPLIHRATQHNFSLVEVDIDLVHGDYQELLRTLAPRSPHDIYIIEPPWGPAYTEQGLDLTATSPPVPDILANIRRSRMGEPFLAVIKTNDQIANNSLRTCFYDAQHLASIIPAPVGPIGVNMNFYLYRVLT
ncbi:class I SAM-dependent methyltransferase [Pseudonocardia sp. ICBG1293]|uniref:class I SAM-dependent methyltransferase n=1 Tax=Pseudonocardia sp. ICBG1293 TaxID=2844382 RepID=UPI001CCD8229|nr:class I SAM-dependent methyltransferase [Pseudonocardia sp. ICBG1293]